MKDPHYGMEVETTYKNKEGQDTPLKYPKIKMNGKTLVEGTRYAITLLRQATIRTVTSAGKTMKFGSAFVKYTGTDYVFVAEVSEYVANILNKYPPGTDLIITKEWFDNVKTGGKTPTLKIEMAKYTDEQVSPQKTLNVNATKEDPYKTKPVTKEVSAWKSFVTTEQDHSLSNWLDYYRLVCGGNLTSKEEMEAVEIYQKNKKSD